MQIVSEYLMEFDNEKLQDELDHARVNYWTVTLICSVFLSFLLDKIIALEFDDNTIMYLILFLFLAIGSLKLSDWVENTKNKIIRNNSFERNW